ncbi:LPS export ABC transporter periplasmic protein LptC [Pseudoxanthomonas mexicana]|uniref:LPS export ABC transporter periplasmic protein LptC n=1 Tax=Pseudoxanthomonas mexicana TaxID=128785 RepID=UPI00398B779C
MNWRRILGGVLLVAALVSGWSAWKQREKPAPTGPLTDRSDYVMRDFELIALDSRGRESLTVRSPQMHRNPADQSFDIATPLFLMPDAEGRHWRMRADTGWLSPKGDELRLRDDVRGDSPEGTERPTTLRTGRLNVFPNTDLAVTDDVVTLTQPGSILSGRGFEANLETKEYLFKSQVKSRYEPRQR